MYDAEISLGNLSSRGGTTFPPPGRTYITPCVEYDRKPRRLIKNDPVHNRHQERICYNGSIKDSMARLQWLRPHLEPRNACGGISQGMQTAEEEVKGNAPICQICEIGEGTTGTLGILVRPVPAKDDEYGEKGIEG